MNILVPVIVHIIKEGELIMQPGKGQLTLFVSFANFTNLNVKDPDGNVICEIEVDSRELDAAAAAMLKIAGG